MKQQRSLAVSFALFRSLFLSFLRLDVRSFPPLSRISLACLLAARLAPGQAAAASLSFSLSFCLSFSLSLPL